MSENIKKTNPVNSRFVVSAILIEEISEFITHISRKYNGSPDMLRATQLMFDSLIEVSIKIEQSRIDRIVVNIDNKQERIECDCTDCRALSKFIEDFKKIGADVHVVKIDKY